MINFIITTQQSIHHEWMAFACWYSIHRNSPESKIAVVFPRSLQQHQFIWLNKCHMPYLAYSVDASVGQAINILIENKVIAPPIIIIKDHHMVIRELEDKITDIVTCEELSCHTKCSSEDAVAIVDYQECGKFILKEWLEKEQKHPFYQTAQLMARNRTVNEQRVFQLWRQMATTFDFLNK